MSRNNDSAFRFNDKGRRTIIAAFSRRVPDAESDDYLVRAEAAIGEVLNTEAHNSRARPAKRELLKAVRRLRTAADSMLSVFAAHPVLDQNSPLHTIALGVQQDISRESLARYDGGAFERHKPRRRPPQTMQTIVVANLRQAYLMATAEADRDCWKVIRATLRAYARQRTADMPTMTLTDHARRRVRALQ